jgi:hypothetical protein
MLRGYRLQLTNSISSYFFKELFSTIILYNYNLVSICIIFHCPKVVEETRQRSITVGQTRIYLQERGKNQSKADKELLSLLNNSRPTRI